MSGFYENMTDERIKQAIAEHEQEAEALRGKENSGMISEFHEPAIHYLKLELEKRKGDKE